MSDPEPYITENGKCSECAWPVDLDDLSALDFKSENGGVFPDADGYTTHWAEGTIACPICSARLWIQVSG